MNETTMRNRIALKREILRKTCVYSLSHFCDGTPNLSAEGIKSGVEAKERCPKYYNCEIRRHSIFDESEAIEE